jgi:hypothetical protein
MTVTSFGKIASRSCSRSWRRSSSLSRRCNWTSWRSSRSSRLGRTDTSLRLSARGR